VYSRICSIVEIEPALDDLIPGKPVKDQTVLGEHRIALTHPAQLCDLEPVIANTKRLALPVQPPGDIQQQIRHRLVVVRLCQNP
jgi:hypothetical protein